MEVQVLSPAPSKSFANPQVTGLGIFVFQALAPRFRAPHPKLRGSPGASHPSLSSGASLTALPRSHPESPFWPRAFRAGPPRFPPAHGPSRAPKIPPQLPLRGTGGGTAFGFSDALDRPRASGSGSMSRLQGGLATGKADSESDMVKGRRGPDAAKEERGHEERASQPRIPVRFDPGERQAVRRRRQAVPSRLGQRAAHRRDGGVRVQGLRRPARREDVPVPLEPGGRGELDVREGRRGGQRVREPRRRRGAGGEEHPGDGGGRRARRLDRPERMARARGERGVFRKGAAPVRVLRPGRGHLRLPERLARLLLLGRLPRREGGAQGLREGPRRGSRLPGDVGFGGRVPLGGHVRPGRRPLGVCRIRLQQLVRGVWAFRAGPRGGRGRPALQVPP